MRNSVQIVARNASGHRESLDLAKPRTDRPKAQAAAALAEQYSNDYIDDINQKREMHNKS